MQPFKIGKDVTVIEAPVSDLQSLSELLQGMQSEPTQTIIRGSLIEGRTNPDLRNKETFTANPLCISPSKVPRFEVKRLLIFQTKIIRDVLPIPALLSQLLVQHLCCLLLETTAVAH